MKKLFVLLLALTLVIGLVPVSHAEEPITLNLWSVFSGDDGITMQNIIHAFNAAHEGKIVVNHTPMAGGDFYTKLPLVVQGGEDIPDVLMLNVERIVKLKDDGVITDLDFLTEGDVNLENYPAELLESVTFDGYLYGIPWDYNAPVCYANLDLVEQYDLDYILEDGYITFDELKEAGKALKDAGAPETLKVINYYGDYSGYISRYEELGGQLTDTEGNLTIDTEVWAKLVETFRELNRLGYAVSREANVGDEFLNGNLLFREAHTSVSASMKTLVADNALTFKYSAYPVPCFTPETALSRSGSHMFAQPEDENRTEEQDMAVATFIDWIGQNSLAWATEAGNVPLYKSVTEEEAFKAMPQVFLADEAMRDHVKVYSYYNWDFFTASVNRVAKDPIYDESIDVMTIGTQIQKEIDDAIAASK